MDFSDQQGFIGNLRYVNEKYLKPADANFKIYEEYTVKPNFISVEKLEDLYKQLIEVIRLSNMPSEKIAFGECFQNYVKHLKIFLIFTYTQLIDVRGNDLLKNISWRDKPVVKKELNNRIKKIKDDIKASLPQINYDNIINAYKDHYDYIEKLCKDHNLI